MADPTAESVSERFDPHGRSTASNQRDVAIVESLPDCVIVTDEEGRVTDFNPAAERIFGIRRADILGKHLVEVILPPSRRATDGDGFLRHIASERALVLGKSTEITAVRADGSEISVELAITRATVGGQAAFIICAHDVTDRKHTEDELRRHDADYARDAALRADVSAILARGVSMREMLQECAEALVRHLDAAFARIWTLRRGGDVLELKASAGAYTRLDGRYGRIPVGHFKIGVIARDCVPCVTNDVLTDPRVDDKEWARRDGIVAFAGYPLVVDEHVVGVVGLFARHTLAPETLHTLQSVAAVVAQGTERRRAEERLRRSEAYLAEGQRLSQTGSWAWNLDTGEMFFSVEMFRIYGFEPADHPPAYEAMLERAHPADVPNVDLAVKEAFRTGTELRLLTRICIPGQPMKWIETYGHPRA
jgi:PAS domain S-box-containing protein